MNRIIETALSQYGIREIKGPENNPEVLKWFSATNAATADWVNDETPSCAAGLSWVLQQSGAPNPKTVRARDFEKWGRHLPELTQQNLEDIHRQGGCVVAVYWRESPESWKGHCALVVRVGQSSDYVLGMNQDDMCCIKEYDRRRLLMYRYWVPEVVPTATEKIIQELKFQDMKGWKTITFFVLTAALAGVDALTDFLTIPTWYYTFVVPGIGFILRFLTDTPVGKAK